MDGPTADSLRVLVVDGETGRPAAGAEVFYCLRVDPAALSESEHRDYLRLYDDVEACARRFGRSVTTGADGSVVLAVRPRFDTLRVGARLNSRYGEAIADALCATVRIALQHDETLRVHVVGPSEEPLPGVELPTSVQISIQPVSSQPVNAATGVNFPPSKQGVGRVEFAYVALGARFQVRANLGGLNLPSREGPGPTSAGMPAVFRFTLDDTQPILQGRLLDDGRAPRTNCTALVSMLIDGASHTHFGTTDAQGHLRVLLGQSLLGRSLQRVQLEQLRNGNSTSVMALLRPTRTLTEGVMDLGDIVLVRGPLVVFGTLTDPAGRPIETRADVRPAAAANDRRIPPLPIAWQQDELGAFTARGFVDHEDLALTFRFSRFAPLAPIPFKRGVVGLRVVLQPLGTIAATLLHDLPFEQVQILQLEIIAEATSAALPRGGSFLPLASDRARLTHNGLNAGRYTVHVRLPGDPVPLATVAGVEVAGDGARDPRLQEIDIRGHVRVARIRLVDHLGQPIRDEGTFRLHDDRALQAQPIRTQDGSLRVPIGSCAVSGTVRTSGWRDQELRDIDGDRTVQLEPSHEVRVRLTPTLGLPEGVTLHAFARLKGQGGSPFDAMLRQQRGPIVGSGTAGTPRAEPGGFTFRLPQAGDYDFTFVLAARQQTVSVALVATPGAAAVGIDGKEIAFATDVAQVQSALTALTR